MNLNALFLAIVSTIFFGTATVFTTKVTRKIGAIPSLFLYQLVGIPMFLFLIPIMPMTPSSFTLWPLLALGLLDAISYSLFMYATKIGELSIVSPVLQIYMVVTTLLGVFLLHESFGPAKIAGLILILIGLILFGFKMTKDKKGLTLLKGVPYSLISSIGIGVFLYFVGIYSRIDGWFLSALYIRISISLVTGILIALRYNISTLFKQIPWKDVAIAAAVDVAGFSIYNIAVSKYEVSSITIITATQSVVTVILANKLFGEKLSHRQIIGFIIIFAGIISLQLK